MSAVCRALFTAHGGEASEHLGLLANALKHVDNGLGVWCQSNRLKILQRKPLGLEQSDNIAYFGRNYDILMMSK